jgi:nicotinate phosphoribosyltransferase
LAGGGKAAVKTHVNGQALLTDLYELTMAASYHQHAMFAPATFSLFIREYPPNRGYLVNAGLDDVLSFLESFHFSEEDLAYLNITRLFSQEFLEYLGGLKFTGEVYAMPEGRLFFKDEPVLELTAPIIQAQMMETLIINAVNLQVTVATKAARCVYSAEGRRLFDFSLRRAQGEQTGLKVSRASYIAGFDGTSNVLAAKLYGIPCSGTMAHSFIGSFPDETDAFRTFAETFPGNAVFLIDTYSTVEGTKKAALVAKEMARQGHKLKGVRLDSGDLALLSKEVRGILDREGLGEVKILASGGLDEYKIKRLLEQAAPIDAFGVGTKMGVSADAPYTDMAYKLVEYDGQPVLKLSSGKKTLVGRKQVYRIQHNSKLAKDIIALRGEKLDGEPLLQPVMSKGNRIRQPESLAAIRERFREELSMLDDDHRRLTHPEPYRVELGPGLRDLQMRTVHQVREKELGES